MLVAMAFASFRSAMNPKEIEDLMYIMNQTRIELTVPDEDEGDGDKEGLLDATVVHRCSIYLHLRHDWFLLQRG